MFNLFRKRHIKIVLLFTILLFALYIFSNQYITNDQIRVYTQDDPSPKLKPKPKVRIYCFILTAPQFFDTRARAVNSTWARRCDNFTFISEPSNDTKGLPIAPIENITAGYGHLTQKSTLALLYIYENFLNTYDWFVKADDDTYIFVENLKDFLKDKNTSEPITYGYNFKTIVEKGYHSGGAGYVLSREAVKRFYEAHQEPNTTCRKDEGAEDAEIAICLRKKGVYPGKSVDQYNRERFHPLEFGSHFAGSLPDWLHQYAETKPQDGLNCCSNTTISFHYVNPEHQYLIDLIRYGFHQKT